VAAPKKVTPKRGRRSARGGGSPWRALALILVAVVGLTGAMFATGTTTPRLGIDLAGGTSILLQARSQPGKESAVNPTNMKTAANIISQRVNGLGVSEAEVQTQGKDHIIVNIPKGPNVEQARKQVGTTAKLNFRPVLGVAPIHVPKTPKTSPSPSSSSGKSGDAASSGSKATAKPSSKTQGRAVSDALTDGKASPSPKPSASAPAPQPTPGAPAAGVSPALQQKLAQLKCTTKQDRAQAGRAAALAKPSATVVACSNEKDSPYKYVLGPVAVQGKHVKDANSAYDSQQGQGWIVQMSFDGKGTKAFADVTGKLAQNQQPKNQFAIVLDGQVVSAPAVHERLGAGSAEISGSFTQQTASDLANVLSYGALPLSFHESNVTSVTAALGSDQLHAGLIAGAIGLALVVLYLLFYYRGLSLVAVTSLLVSAILTYTIMTLLGPAIGFALNLPAVCGAIVAIGITADSFIVYFERIRDEVREGRRLRAAVERGWPRARRTILVSDFVSFLAAAVLFIVTVGKVKGFAFTLGLTTILDVVVVFLFTKPWMTVLARTKFFSGQHPWSGLDPKRLGAQPPLRRTRRQSRPGSDPKEA
jgi:preprotein translocase subunit SecD